MLKTKEIELSQIEQELEYLVHFVMEQGDGVVWIKHWCGEEYLPASNVLKAFEEGMLDTKSGLSNHRIFLDYSDFDIEISDPDMTFRISHEDVISVKSSDPTIIDHFRSRWHQLGYIEASSPI